MESAAPVIVVVNAAVVSGVLILGAFFLGRRHLTEGVPEGTQNFGEFMLDFFVGKARDMATGGHRRRVVRVVAPFLASFFLFILASNVIAVLPLPEVNMPPTAYYAATLGLAACAVAGTLVIGGMFRGPLGAVKHLFWPNPMQFVSEVTDVLSLSLRLFGNIGGEYMTIVLVASVVPWGIPLILHALGLIPAFVQALVFTLLTASFLAGAIHHEEKRVPVRETAPGETAEDAGEPAEEPTIEPA